MIAKAFNSQNYRFGFNGKENDNELEDWQDYGERSYMTRIARFASVDPISAKFPMLSPYQFASLNPIMNIDLDGLEGYQSIGQQLWKSIGVTTATADQIESDVKEGIVKAGRLSQDALIITGGVLTIVASGGAAAPIAFGIVATAGGSTKFYYDAVGEYNKSDATPTTISGTVMVTANYMVGEKVFSESFVATVEFVEGVVILDLKNLKSPNLTAKANETVSLLNLAINGKSLPENLKNVLSTTNSPLAPQNQNIAPADNTYVAPKPMPEIKPDTKNTNQNSNLFVDPPKEEKKNTTNTTNTTNNTGG
jgi:RHS repeat-associated protein